MRKQITVVADQRGSRGKNEARRLRASGKVPAVLYGPGGDNVVITVNPKEVNRILHSKTGHNTIFDVQVNGEKSPVMIVDWQNDPIKGNLLHIDLKRIDLTKRLKVKVPVHTAGDPFGVKTQGGLLEIVNREIEIECLPDDIPDHFVVDVTGLTIGQNLRASYIAMSGGMVLTSSPDSVICHVIAIRTSDVTAVAAEEEAPAAEAKAEPEVIKKGKKEEEAPAETKKK